MATRKKTAFLKQKPLSTANLGKSAGKFAIRGGSAIAAKAGSNALSNIAPMWHSPVLMALGLAGEMFIENEYARAAAEGIGTYGAMKATEDFIPQGSALRAPLGLGATDSDNTVIDSTPNWDALAEDMDFEDIIEDEEPEFTDEDFEDFQNAEEEMETLSSLPI